MSCCPLRRDVGLVGRAALQGRCTRAVVISGNALTTVVIAGPKRSSFYDLADAVNLDDCGRFVGRADFAAKSWPSKPPHERSAYERVYDILAYLNRVGAMVEEIGAGIACIRPGNLATRSPPLKSMWPTRRRRAAQLAGMGRYDHYTKFAVTSVDTGRARFPGCSRIRAAMPGTERTSPRTESRRPHTSITAARPASRRPTGLDRRLHRGWCSRISTSGGHDGLGFDPGD